MELKDNVYNDIKTLILDCGQIIIDANKDSLGIENKEGNNNIVTKYDVMIQNKIKKRLLELVPDAGFLGEENDCQDDLDNEYVFVVDPIDGTVNFSRGIGMSAISICLLRNGKPYIGFCYNPYANELYEAKLGCGAYLNGKQIHVSKIALKNGLVFSGCAPYYNELREKSLELQKVFASVASDFRRLGTAVIELCDIAAGRAELYFETKIMPWDHAAGDLMITEAGGTVTTLEGDEIQYFKPTSILASNNYEDYSKYLK